MTAEKQTCTLCGTDVSRAKRAKDSKGRLYCEPCAVKKRAAATSLSKVDENPKICANCGNAVGALQQLFDWQEKRVCIKCRDTLTAERDTIEELLEAKRMEMATHVATEAARVKVEATRSAGQDPESTFSGLHGEHRFVWPLVVMRVFVSLLLHLGTLLWENQLSGISASGR